MADVAKFLSLAVAFFAIAGLLIVFGVFDQCSRSASEAAISNEIREIPPAFNLTPSQLVRAYRSDEESAAATFNDRVVIIKGPALLVKQSNHLRFFVNKVWAVRCFLSNEQMHIAGNLYHSGRRVPLGETYEFRTGASWPTAVESLPLFVLKGKVEGVNNKILTIDIRGCALQDSP